MTRTLRLLLLLSLSSPLWAQHVQVSGQLMDSNGTLYSNCHGSAAFIGQNSTPGAGPYLLSGSTFQTVANIFCDSQGNFAVTLADNNLISPTPSQWNFSVCSASGYLAGPFCLNALITITGTSQVITTTLQAVAPILPITLNLLTKVNGTAVTNQALLNFTDASGCTWTNPSGGLIEVSCSGGGGTVTGTGTSGTLAIWTGTSALGNSNVTVSGGVYTISDSNPTIASNTGSTFQIHAATNTNIGGILLMQAGGTGCCQSVDIGVGGASLVGSSSLRVVTDNSNNGTFLEPNDWIYFPTTINADLPTTNSAAGAMIWCTDCTIASNPCTGSGTGALAIRLTSSAWRCL